MTYPITDPGLPGGTGRAAATSSVTGFFDTQDAADAACRDLVRAGVPSDAVRFASGRTSASDAAHPHGLWESLKDFFLPDPERHVFAEGLRRGGIALSVPTDDAAVHDRVVEILDRNGAVDLEDRSAGWRGEGWRAPEGAGEGEMAYAAAGDATGGFTVSRADQPLFDGPIDTATIEPGQIVPPASPTKQI